ncbi:MAG: radical SAM superfamily enzyme YgiQ (UPF0313 family), partial [Polaribacter sp.]
MKRLKVLLYNPVAVFYDMPLALLAIGSIMDPKKYEVIIIDGRIEEDPIKIIQEHVDEAICFGVTSLTGRPIQNALDITQAVRNLRQDIPIIWGGWHTSLFPEQTLKDELCIDVTVQGQGEDTFKELVETFESDKDVSKVKGICYRSNTG